MDVTVLSGEQAISTPSRWRRVINRAFPRAPQPEIDGEVRTYLTINVHIVIDWRDRLRILVTGRALVQVRAYTDVEVASATSVSTFSVDVF